MRATNFRWWLAFALTVGVTLAACSARRPAPAKPPPPPARAAVPETGVNHDLAELNGAVVAVKPGDTLTLPLVGKGLAGYQWSFRSPVRGGYLTLKRHTVTDADSRSTPPPRRGEPKQTLTAWVFKVERPATFTLRFDYEHPFRRRRAPAEFFTAMIVADRTLAELPNFLLEEPSPQTVTSGSLQLAAYVRQPVEKLTYRLQDDAGGLVTDGAVAVEAAGKAFHRVETAVRFALPTPPTGTLTVSDGAGGANDVAVPLVFHPDETTVAVFYPNRELDPTSSCTAVFAVKRYLPKTDQLLTAAVTQLLAGPTPAERRAGYTTSLPTGVRLTSLALTDGRVRADFTRRLTQGVASSCRVQAIRAQLEQTLRQFP